MKLYRELLREDARVDVIFLRFTFVTSLATIRAASSVYLEFPSPWYCALE